jgi:fatty-acyl-CoA synthase
LETVGQPLPQTAVTIRDPNSQAVMPVGAVGEVCVRSYGVMIGYNDDPDATAKAVDGDGWLHEGEGGAVPGPVSEVRLDHD